MLARITLNLLCQISADNAIFIKSIQQNLQHIRFTLNAYNEEENFRARLSNEWECKMEGDNLTEYKQIYVKRIGPMAKNSKFH